MSMNSESNPFAHHSLPLPAESDADATMQKWIGALKEMLPEGTPVISSCREVSKNQWQASFRVKAFGRMIAAVSTEFAPERALNAAAQALCRRIGSERKKIIGKRKRAVFHRGVA